MLDIVFVGGLMLIVVIVVLRLPKNQLSKIAKEIISPTMALVSAAIWQILFK